MNVMTGATLVAAVVAALLTALLWLTMRRHNPGGASPGLREAVEGMRVGLSTMGKGLHNDLERTQRMHVEIMNGVQGELRSSSEGQGRQLSAGVEMLRSSQATELSLVRTELTQSLTESQKSLIASVNQLRSNSDEQAVRQSTAAREASEALSASQRAELTALRTELTRTLQETQKNLVAALQQMRQSAEEHAVAQSVAAREAAEKLAVSQRTELTSLRTELTQAVQESQKSLLATAQQMRADAEGHSNQQSVTSREAAEALSNSQRASLNDLRQSVQHQLTQLLERNDTARTELTASMGAGRQEQTTVLQGMQKSHNERVEALTVALQDQQQRSRQELSESIAGMMKSNEAKLDQMRATVQEKLDATLSERFDASFKQVSDRLEHVHRGLGEMQEMAKGVGSLQRTLTNVKTRGAWAELQLEALLVDLLTPEQYRRQFRINPESQDLVDFAIKLPGQSDDSPVWLAVDSKFPMDVYEGLLAAWETNEPELIKSSTRALLDRIRAEATSISGKYVHPPHTTDFALMYLPTEGLFAEVVRQIGLVHELRTKYRIIVAGPRRSQP